MSMNPMVSIIIPHFNRCKLLIETIDSIRVQTFKEIEIIIVDDGSDNDSLIQLQEIIGIDERIRLINRASLPKGPSVCRNIGAQTSKGKYLLFLDSDDVISKTCLQNRVSFLEANPDLDFAVFTQAVFEKTPGDTNIIFNLFFNDSNKYLEAFIEDSHPWQTSGPLWNKNAFQSIGGFNEDYLIMEDPELHIRALANNLKFKVINDKPDFFYRQLPKEANELNAFWENSINGRVVFFKDIYAFLEKKQLLIKYNDNLTKGIIKYFKQFLLARSSKNIEAYENMLDWCINKKILPSNKIILIRLYHFLNSSSSFLSKIGLKGIVYKMI